ncbi:hypothetical protein [Ruminiclostridium cellulolyticum]|uniref:Uncharacterized protein n=1 Tax=Ruminiclostridium cellulolyticum (strain ATCC 35319 / DSM 5812 / JCM 6584 / H10) TaxID=394503 RepID=B8I5X9_RUMCH|nr:hypothetical protein [Ruminiclostridium cellulolyticum]ACL74796.1 hypothetical protein Ccel_0412 [Ruminiclostridium cellulolyticum H10]
MPYFGKSNKLANILICCSVILFVIAAVVFVRGSVLDQVFEFSNGNYISSGIYFTIFMLLALFTFIIGIALKCVVKDAKYEFTNIKSEQRGES